MLTGQRRETERDETAHMERRGAQEASERDLAAEVACREGGLAIVARISGSEGKVGG